MERIWKSEMHMTKVERSSIISVSIDDCLSEILAGPIKKATKSIFDAAEFRQPPKVLCMINIQGE